MLMLTHVSFIVGFIWILNYEHSNYLEVALDLKEKSGSSIEINEKLWVLIRKISQ